MNKKDLIIIILAGGKGSRVSGKIPKILLKIKNKSLINFSINLAEKFSKKINIIINNKLIFLKKKLKKYKFFIQRNSLGTGHAVQIYIKKNKISENSIFLILYADTPFILKKDIYKMIKKIAVFDLVILAFKSKNNNGCGLIKKDEEIVYEIIEYKNANSEEKKIELCNSGVMLFNSNVMKLVKKIKKNKISKEFYLTDLIKLASQKKFKIGYVISNSEIRSRGINDIDAHSYNKKFFKTNSINL